MLNSRIRERILWLFSWEALFNRFDTLSRCRRRILGALVHASCLSGVAVFFLSGESLRVLLTPVLLAVSVAVYIPLSAYLGRMDHQRAGNRLLSAGRKMDDYEAELLRETLDIVRWIQGAALLIGCAYVMQVSITHGWPLPQTLPGWGAIMFALVWLLVYSLPTVVATWIDEDHHPDEDAD